MTLDADEFVRRSLMHVLPEGLRRIRRFGFLANARRAQKLAHIRAALDIVDPPRSVESADYRERNVIWSYDLPARSLPVLAGFHSASACAYR